MISARIEADSISEAGSRLTTFVLVYPRFIHSEIMTHRMFSRNAASSRAIPFRRMVEMVQENIAMPVYWGSSKPGMQSGEEIEDIGKARQIWCNALYAQIGFARQLDEMHVHKSISNRLLEPFAHMVTIVSATDWGNFFHLRAHKDAMPEFQALAYEMLEVYLRSEPDELKQGQWHLPLVARDPNVPLGLPTDSLVKMCVARCARVSYINFKDSTIVQDIELHDRLASAGHWSPFEHAATPMTIGSEYSGNFRGWFQYRKMFDKENVMHADLKEILSGKVAAR